MRWGVFGAAGVVFVRRSGDEWLVLLQMRSQWSHEGGTWSCPGGALDEGESAFDGAMREASEEIGAPGGQAAVLGEYVFTPATDWTYTTIVVEVAEAFGMELNFESESMAWVPIADVDGLRLHQGFAAAWPFVRPIVEGSVR
jgi:8-oxo-dGTP diphosphatase